MLNVLRMYAVGLWRDTVGRLICRLTEHDAESHTMWNDWGYEKWAKCRRCGEVWPP